MNKQKILVIGAGRMAEAIIAGLLRTQKEQLSEIIVSNRSDQARREELQKQYRVTVTSDWSQYVASADVVLLAMPPQNHRDVLPQLAPHIEGQLVVTVAAGIGIGILEEMLPQGTPVAWVMPNTAASTGESMSLFTCGQHVGTIQRQALDMILAGIGESQECTEQQIHDLTAITGSAPAFLYRFVEVLQTAAQAYGVTEETAEKLVSQMVFGSAAMLREGEKAEALRHQVTTPGGATAAGIAVLEERDMADMLQQAVRATNDRARELGENE